VATLLITMSRPESELWVGILERQCSALPPIKICLTASPKIDGEEDDLQPEEEGQGARSGAYEGGPPPGRQVQHRGGRPVAWVIHLWSSCSRRRRPATMPPPISTTMFVRPSTASTVSSV
jgi:hypothetical protein